MLCAYFFSSLSLSRADFIFMLFSSSIGYFFHLLLVHFFLYLNDCLSYIRNKSFKSFKTTYSFILIAVSLLFHIIRLNILFFLFCLHPFCCCYLFLLACISHLKHYLKHLIKMNGMAINGNNYTQIFLLLFFFVAHSLKHIKWIKICH